MQNKIAVGISFPTKLMERIDMDRGDIPRSRYVLRILEKQYLFKQIREKGSLEGEFATFQSSKPISQ